MGSGKFAAIILAGGLSSRMQGFKPLLPLGDGTIVDRVVSLFVSNGIEVFLVSGYRKQELLSGVKEQHINIVENPDYEKGMFSSVKAGISRLKPEHQAFFIIPADIPLVRPSTIKRLMDASENNPDKIIFPLFGVRRGHPPLLPASMAETVLGWNQSGGLKSCLLSQKEKTLEIPVADRFILFDVDTQKDYEMLLNNVRRYEVPTDEECEEILNNICRVAPQVLLHSQMVSKVAAAIAEKFKQIGKEVDIDLVRGSAMLHDIAKGQPHHDAVGGEILKRLGFGKAGEIVSIHTDLSKIDRKITLEDKIVYLADKFVKGEELVSIEARFSFAGRQYGSEPGLEDKIRKRKERALKTKIELEKSLGCTLEEISSSITR